MSVYKLKVLIVTYVYMKLEETYCRFCESEMKQSRDDANEQRRGA